jgi:hypothetical protein
MGNGIFGSHVFSGYGTFGLGLMDLDKIRASLVTQGKNAGDIAIIMAWAQKVRDLEAKIGESATRNSTTDATYAHYLMALNPATMTPSTGLTANQKQALAYEAQQQYMATHPNPQIVTTPDGGPERSIVPPTTGATAPSKMPLVLGGVAAVAVVGGLLYWKFGRKKKAAAA